MEFWIAESASAHADEVGRALVALYTRLWDEDEEMMIERSAQLAARSASPSPGARDPGPLDLGPLASLRTALPRTVEFGEQRYRIVDLDGELLVHSVLCPHLLGPLGDCEICGGELECPWHGYRFDLRSGRSCDGRRFRLAEAPRIAVEGERARLEF